MSESIESPEIVEASSASVQLFDPYEPFFYHTIDFVDRDSSCG